MELFLDSIKLAVIISAGMGLFLALALPLRMHTLWKRVHLVRVAMPCDHPEQVRARIAEAFKGIGQPQPARADGSFVYEPMGWRKTLGLKPVTVDFPEPRLALITGQANLLTGFAARYGFSCIEVPGASFGDYMKRQAKVFGCGLAILCVILFIGFEITDPDNLSTRKTQGHRHVVAAANR